MNLWLDCLPCVTRQVVEASRMATPDPELQAQIVDECVGLLADYRHYTCAPDLARAFHQVVKRVSGNPDPYRGVKEEDIRVSKEAYPRLCRFVAAKEDRLYWALKTAAVGNGVDSAIVRDTSSDLERELEKEFALSDVPLLREKLAGAEDILIVADNAGETFYDRVLLKYLPSGCVPYAVRGEPILNDATLKEAYESGLDEYARLITTGCGAPGALLEDCGEEFLNQFYHADIVISKGQGNFEALSECRRPVFFLLKAKCPKIAQVMGIELNGYILLYQEGART